MSRLRLVPSAVCLSVSARRHPARCPPARPSVRPPDPLWHACACDVLQGAVLKRRCAPIRSFAPVRPASACPVAPAASCRCFPPPLLVSCRLPRPDLRSLRGSPRNVGIPNSPFRAGRRTPFSGGNLLALFFFVFLFSRFLFSFLIFSFCCYFLTFYHIIFFLGGEAAELTNRSYS